MRITRENYEEYFLDYIEGNLDPSLYNELLDFLNSNSDLKEELSIYQENDIILESHSDINFPDKNNLKKNEDFLNENLIIASLEGDLSIEEKRDFLNQVEEDLELKNEYIQFKKAKLKPDLSKIFSNKNSLKRSFLFGLRRKTVYSTISAAATILLLFSVYFSFITMFDSEERHYSERSNVNSVTEPESDYNSKLLADNKTEDINSGNPEKDKKPIVDKSELPDKKEKKKSGKKAANLKKVVQPISAKRDSLSIKLKKLSPSRDSKLPVNKRIRNTKPILKPVEIQSQGLLADATYSKEEYLTVKQLLGKSFNKIVLNNDEPNSYSLNAWDIADAGLQRINRLTGREMGFTREYDDNGELVAYSFKSGKFSFGKDLNN